jgi:hypothetical protein
MLALPVSRTPRLTGEARIAALTISEGKIDWRRKFFLPQGKSSVVFSLHSGVFRNIQNSGTIIVKRV